ncbi:hypothetical protein HDV01_002112 [Terramyces sp. JEL0728]|nr:hypothetical protein HDV01_002112 [Terramyces sp. JEL0728]
MLVVFITDFEVLRVFSVIDGKIWDKQIRIIRVVVATIYLGIFVTNILTFVLPFNLVFVLSSGLLGIFSAATILFDNCQFLYLAVILYKFKQQQNQQTDTSVSQFKELVKFFIFVVVLDWSGLAFFACFLIFGSPICYYFQIGATFVACVHGLLLIQILKMFTGIMIERKSNEKDNDPVVVLMHKRQITDDRPTQIIIQPDPRK